MSQRKHKGFDIDGFHSAIRGQMAARGKNWKQVSAETGVSTSTLNRMSKGSVPDGASLAALSAWAGLNVADFVLVPFKGAPQTPSPLQCIPGARPLTPEQQQELAAFRECMTEVVIPEIVRIMQKRADLAYRLFSSRKP